MNQKTGSAQNFTEGPILMQLVRFSIPVLFALLLQATYGAVDLLIVGQFATSADVSAVATGSNIMLTLTGPISTTPASSARSRSNAVACSSASWFF